MAVAKQSEEPACRCAVCGRPLKPGEWERHHLHPLAAGGSDAPDNLILLCHDCHHTRVNRSFSESAFMSYVIGLLNRSPDYDDIRQNVPLGNRRLADLVFRRRAGNGRPAQRILAEVKAAAGGFTDDRLSAVIARLLEEQTAMPDALPTLIIPAQLSDSHRSRLQEAGIALWDIAFLAKTFAHEMRESPHFGEPAAASVSPARELIRRLKACPCGREHWSRYQKWVGEALALLFCPPLAPPIEQDCDLGAANRRDFILPNYAYDNEWRYLRERYRADYLVVDAKNTGKAVTKADILQMAHYLCEKGPGMLGIICCRRGGNTGTRRHQRDLWLMEGKMILLLDDSELEQMLLNKEADIPPVSILMKKIEDLRLSV